MDTKRMFFFFSPRNCYLVFFPLHNPNATATKEIVFGEVNNKKANIIVPLNMDVVLDLEVTTSTIGSTVPMPSHKSECG